MQLYTGFDLHSSNSYVGIIDENGKRVFKKKLPNDPEQIVSTLEPYKDTIIGIVVESTYNWYWLVDIYGGRISGSFRQSDGDSEIQWPQVFRRSA